MSKSMSNWIVKSQYSSKVSNSSKSLSSKRIKKNSEGILAKMPYKPKASQFATGNFADEESSDGSASEESLVDYDEEKAASDISQKFDDRET